MSLIWTYNKEFYKKNLKKNAGFKIYGIFEFYDFQPKTKLQKKLKTLNFKLQLLKEQIQFIFFHKVNIPWAEFVITTNCTLRCKNCANLISLINTRKDISMPYNISYEEFCNDLDKLLIGVNEIKIFTVIGGEPFLHKDLVKILRYINTKNKIKRFSIVTNGTIIPNEDTLKELAKLKRFVVNISDYSSNPELKTKVKREQLINELKKYNVKYTARNNFFWHVMGDVTDRKRTKEENLNLYKLCDNSYTSIIDGGFYVCPRGSNITRLKGTEYCPPPWITFTSEIIKMLKRLKENGLIFIQQLMKAFVIIAIPLKNEYGVL